MDNLKNHVIALLCTVATITSWLIPNLDTSTKIIITLLFLLISLGCYTLTLYHKSNRFANELCRLKEDYQKLSIDYSDKEQKHKALGEQFNEKKQIIKDFENAELSIIQLLGMALLNAEEIKVKMLAESIMFHFKNIK